MYHCKLLVVLIFLVSLSSCSSQSRVFYNGISQYEKSSGAVFTTETEQELIDTGYEKIGTITSEPTTHGLSVSKQEYKQNPQVVLDSISPENTESLAAYYSSLDKEVLREAQKTGGEKVRLEKIKHEYPSYPEHIQKLMYQAMANGLTVKNVTSIKIWSVWKKNERIMR